MLDGICRDRRLFEPSGSASILRANWRHYRSGLSLESGRLPSREFDRRRRTSHSDRCRCALACLVADENAERKRYSLSTGFFPNPNPRSLQSRSSVLGRSSRGAHVPRLDGRPIRRVPISERLSQDFAGRGIVSWATHEAAPPSPDGWSRISERATLDLLRDRRIRTFARLAIRPAVLRSVPEREALIRGRCRRNGVASSVIEAEVRALKQLEYPLLRSAGSRQLPPGRSASRRGSSDPSHWDGRRLGLNGHASSSRIDRCR